VGKYWTQLAKLINARKQEERVVVLLAFIATLVYAGLYMVIEPLQLKQADAARRIAVTRAQVLEEESQQAQIRATYNTDPDSFARERQQELLASVAEADLELDRLYGQLIDPREMSLMLTRILQRETTLELISLNNTPSELLLSSAISEEVEAGLQSSVELYRHGLQMVFEGTYLDTIRYLQSLEALENNFFWETLEYSVQAYPKARITLDIYTLSTQRGWIGV
jgi:MSHA biogenesis protein MshJ